MDEVVATEHDPHRLARTPRTGQDHFGRRISLGPNGQHLVAIERDGREF